MNSDSKMVEGKQLLRHERKAILRGSRLQRSIKYLQKLTLYKPGSETAFSFSCHCVLRGAVKSAIITATAWGSTAFCSIRARVPFIQQSGKINAKKLLTYLKMVNISNSFLCLIVAENIKKKFRLLLLQIYDPINDKYFWLNKLPLNQINNYLLFENCSDFAQIL